MDLRSTHTLGEHNAKLDQLPGGCIEYYNPLSDLLIWASLYLGTDPGSRPDGE